MKKTKTNKHTKHVMRNCGTDVKILLDIHKIMRCFAASTFGDFGNAGKSSRNPGLDSRKHPKP